MSPSPIEGNDTVSRVAQLNGGQPEMYIPAKRFDRIFVDTLALLDPNAVQRPFVP